jgi:hypothetical protein
VNALRLVNACTHRCVSVLSASTAPDVPFARSQFIALTKSASWVGVAYVCSARRTVGIDTWTRRTTRTTMTPARRAHQLAGRGFAVPETRGRGSAVVASTATGEGGASFGCPAVTQGRTNRSTTIQVVSASGMAKK